MARIADRALLALVNRWCRRRHRHLWQRTFKDSHVAPAPATPVSYADKFLWRKIFDRDPRFVTCCDKLGSKQYALTACPGLKTAKVLWSGEDAAAIPPALLAGNVVVKANHGCRWNVMVRNGDVDVAALREKAAGWLARSYGQSQGEWAYSGAARRLLVEEMLLEDGDAVRTEYKFHVSGGRTAYVYAARRTADGERKCHFDRDGRFTPPPPGSGAQWAEIEVPASFGRMRQIAETLTAPFDHMRCDFYELNGEIYFSEFSVYPLSGKGIINHRLRDHCAATWDIRQSWFLTAKQSGWRKLYAAALLRWLDEYDPAV